VIVRSLLLILSLLLATNAWAEMKILNCKVKVDDDENPYSVRINFDLDLPVAEIWITYADETPVKGEEVDLKITPSKLIFTDQSTNYGSKISVDRENLLAKLSDKNPKNLDDWKDVGSGTCKIQRGSRKI